MTDLRQQFLRSLARDGRPPLRIVASNEPVVIGPLAPRTWTPTQGSAA